MLDYHRIKHILAKDKKMIIEFVNRVHFENLSAKKTCHLR